MDEINHIHAGLARIGHQYAHSQKFKQWVTATLEPLNNIEAAFLSLLNLDIDTAEGVVLRLFGRIVGAPEEIPDAIPLPFFGFEGQEGALGFGDTNDANVGGFFRESYQDSNGVLTFTDTLYRKVIKAQILKNTSLCTPDEVIQSVKIITDTPFTYIDGEMFIRLAPQGSFTQAEKQMMKYLLPRPASVGLIIVNGWHDGFGWAEQTNALGFGDTSDPDIGGYWAEEVRL